MSNKKTKMKNIYIMCICFSFIRLYIAPPIEKNSNKQVDDTHEPNKLTIKEAQNEEYFRYLSQIVGELDKDPSFQKSVENITEDEIRSGKVADMLDVVGHDVRTKIDEIKRLEVEYQRELLRQKKHHMTGIEENYWNPIHHDNQHTFEKEDLKKLLHRHNAIMSETDKSRHEDFKKYELEKEHKRREAMKNMTVEEKIIEERKHNESHHKPHEKLHEPGHKAQMEEVWEKEDGFDIDSFDAKTFFNLHDKNSDGYWDYFELETLFLHDLDKIYNTTDPDTDLREREEEMERMREHAFKTFDHDRDGLISIDEYISETKTDSFSKEEEWKPLTDEDQYTENEFTEYERLLDLPENHHEKNEETRHETNAAELHKPQEATSKK